MGSYLLVRAQRQIAPAGTRKKMERLCEASCPIAAHELQLNRLASAAVII